MPPGPHQPYGGYPYAPPRTTNGFAIASMVLGILWLYWIGSILALVFGYVAQSQIRERGEAGGGTATAGIVLDWIGVGSSPFSSPSVSPLPSDRRPARPDGAGRGRGGGGCGARIGA
jgi:uncharacterized protein DUF4190